MARGHEDVSFAMSHMPLLFLGHFLGATRRIRGKNHVDKVVDAHVPMEQLADVRSRSRSLSLCVLSFTSIQTVVPQFSPT